MATREWEKKNKVFIGANLMRSTDGDIIDWIEKQTNRQGAIKEALRYYLDHTGYRQGDKPTPSEEPSS
jgi:hypothetical protein